MNPNNPLLNQILKFVRQLKFVFYFYSRLLLLLVILFTFSSCSNGRFECINSKSSYISETRAIKGYHSIEIYDNFDVHITSDSLPQSSPSSPLTVRFETLDYLIPNLYAEVKDSVLIIKNNNSCGFLRNPNERIRLTIHIPPLKHFIINDIVQINQSEAIRGKEFEFEHNSKQNARLHFAVQSGITIKQNNAGNGIYSGYCPVIVYEMTDFGTIDATQLKGDYVYAYQYSLNDCHLWAVKNLDGLIFNEGSVYYHHQKPWTSKQKVFNGTGKMVFVE